jgi:hypothetical protein
MKFRSDILTRIHFWCFMIDISCGFLRLSRAKESVQIRSLELLNNFAVFKERLWQTPAESPSWRTILCRLSASVYLRYPWLLCFTFRGRSLCLHYTVMILHMLPFPVGDAKCTIKQDVPFQTPIRIRPPIGLENLFSSMALCPSTGLELEYSCEIMHLQGTFVLRQGA